MLISLTDPKLKRKNGFIVLEGVNGAGKSTVKAHISGILKKNNTGFVETFEPGDGELGKKIRKIVLEREVPIKSELTELFLFAADRAEHVETIIKPAIAGNKLVLCDRYHYSTTAFQGYGRGINLDVINQINSIAIKETLPDLVILLDIDAEEGLKRTRKRNPDSSDQDAFEKEQLEFHKRIRQGFLEIAKNSTDSFVIIDSSKPLDMVLSEIDLILSHYLS